MGQRFKAQEPVLFGCGAIGWGPKRKVKGEALWPFAKVQNCELKGVEWRRLTCYASVQPGVCSVWSVTGEPVEHWYVSACCRVNGLYVKGLLVSTGKVGSPWAERTVSFTVDWKYQAVFETARKARTGATGTGRHVSPMKGKKKGAET